MTDVVFLPPWGGGWILAGAILLAGLALLRARRERSAATARAPSLVRLALVLALVLIAINPTRVRTRPTDGRPALTVVVDTSASMGTRDVDGGTRLDAALAKLSSPAVRDLMEGAFECDVRAFDERPRPASLDDLDAEDAVGRASDPGRAIVDAVRDLARREPRAGVLLVGDGRATAGGAEDAARLALARSVPIWTWCLGGPVERRDVWVEAPQAEVLAFAGEEVEIGAEVHAVGYDERTVEVEVLRSGEVIERSRTRIPADGRAPVKARVPAPDEGEARYTFRVAPSAGASGERPEADPDNNERAVFVRTVGARVRVLVVEGQPHWETKFLVQSLKRSPHVDVTALYRLGSGKRFAVLSTPAEGEGGERREERRENEDLFPRSADAFRSYDVVILGRSCESFFEAETEAHLTEYVARGGGRLVFGRGKGYEGRFRALSKLEPVVWGRGFLHSVRFTPVAAPGDDAALELSTTGDTEALLGRLPPLDRAMDTVGAKPLATVVARGRTGVEATDPTRPGQEEPPILVAYQLYGLGRVVTVNASGLWRWAFREEGPEDEEQVYDRFWIGLLRWLLSGSDFASGQDVALRTDRRLYTDEQTVRFLIRTRGVDPEVYRPRLEIRAGDETTEVEPRRRAPDHWVAEAGPFPPGSREAILISNVGRPDRVTLSFEVVSGSIEARRLDADPAAMARLAEISSGRALTGEEIDRLDEIAKEWRRRSALDDETTPLWTRAGVLAAILALAGIEWLLRRRGGLL